MKSQVLHTVWCNISGEAAGEIWNWSLSGVKGLTHRRGNQHHGTSHTATPGEQQGTLLPGGEGAGGKKQLKTSRTIRDGQAHAAQQYKCPCKRARHPQMAWGLGIRSRGQPCSNTGSPHQIMEKDAEKMNRNGQKPHPHPPPPTLPVVQTVSTYLTRQIRQAMRCLLQAWVAAPRKWVKFAVTAVYQRSSWKVGGSRDRTSPRVQVILFSLCTVIHIATNVLSFLGRENCPSIRHFMQ